MIFRNEVEYPSHWFKSIHDLNINQIPEPEEIEYLKTTTGETFIHIGGTAYYREGNWDLLSMIQNGITHWRVHKLFEYKQ